ncbi:MAG: GAF domain-containing protein [Aggregatilineales bacterium]
MIADFSRRYLRVRYPYENLLDRQRATGLLYTIVALSPIWFLWTIYYVTTLINGNPFLSPSQYSVTMLLPIIVPIVVVSIQNGRLNQASWVFTLWFSIALGVANLESLTGISLPFIFLPLVVAGLLLRGRGILVITLINILVVSLGAFSQSQLTDPQTVIPADSVITTLMAFLSTILLMGSFFRAFGVNTEQIVENYLGIATHYRKLNLMTQVSADADEYQVYAEAINMIRSDLGFVFAQIYLADEDGKLSRRVRVGRSDNRNITVQVDVPEESTLYETAQSRESVIVTLDDAPTRREHLLPSVHRGMSLPIIGNDEFMGVLDVQTGEELFTQDDQKLLQTLADNLGTMVGQIRRIVSLQDALARQETMLDHLRNQADSPGNRSVNTESLAWNTYLQRTESGFGFDIDGKPGIVTAAADLSPELLKSLKSGQIVTDVSGEQTSIVIPIRLRGEILGAMQFHTARLTNRQIDIAQKISDRLAQALENRRLFEQSQAQANRERKATEVANQLISATEVNAVLDLAATTFNEALGAVQTRIQIKPSLVRDIDAVVTQAYPQITPAEVSNSEVVEKEGTINE